MHNTLMKTIKNVNNNNKKLEAAMKLMSIYKKNKSVTANKNNKSHSSAMKRIRNNEPPKTLKRSKTTKSLKNLNNN